MVAITIGVGEEHNFYAHEAARRMRKYTGLDTYILDDNHMKEYGSHPVFKLADPKKCECHYIKFFIWDILPNENDILYFDCDYCALREFQPDLYLDYGLWASPTNALLTVRDRTSELQPHKQNIATVLHYFNAGFFIARRDRHQGLAELCKKYPNRDGIQWNDQCIWNQTVVNNKTKISYLPRIFNFLDTGQPLLDSNPYAIHSSANYDHYRAGTQIKTSDKLEWDLTEMANQQGLNICYGEDRPYSVYLLSDGTDSNGHIWFISNGKHYKCGVKGAWIKEVEYAKISDE